MPSTLHRLPTRLFELVAEEIAIEDTIYYLGKALSQDKVELNAYMKVGLAEVYMMIQVPFLLDRTLIRTFFTLLI